MLWKASAVGRWAVLAGAYRHSVLFASTTTDSCKVPNFTTGEAECWAYHLGGMQIRIQGRCCLMVAAIVVGEVFGEGEWRVGSRGCL